MEPESYLDMTTAEGNWQILHTRLFMYVHINSLNDGDPVREDILVSGPVGAAKLLLKLGMKASNRRYRVDYRKSGVQDGVVQAYVYLN